MNKNDAVKETTAEVTEPLAGWVQALFPATPPPAPATRKIFKPLDKPATRTPHTAEERTEEIKKYYTGDNGSAAPPTTLLLQPKSSTRAFDFTMPEEWMPYINKNPDLAETATSFANRYLATSKPDKKENLQIRLQGILERKGLAIEEAESLVDALSDALSLHKNNSQRTR